MKVHLLFSAVALSLLTLLTPVLPAQEAKLRWYDAADLALEGRGWTDTKHRYDRLPAKAEALVRRPVWDLSQHSAGLCVRFVTNATTISARWTLRNSRLEMPHMPATGVSGVDLYVRSDGRWSYLGTGRPAKFPDNEGVLIRELEPVEREFVLYFPLYNGVDRVEIGVPESATFQSAKPSSTNPKPLVIYGTSITQGGCAARPGMAYPAILSRTLNIPVINLGFSGNGKTEPEMAQLLAELDPAAFVLDSLANLDTAQVGERLPPFVEILRQRHPVVPIILLESIPYPDKSFVAKRNERFVGSNQFVRKLYEERRRKGDQQIYYADSRDFLGNNGEGTVDGVHPTDLGFQQMADALAPQLRAIPGLIAKPSQTNP